MNNFYVNAEGEVYSLVGKDAAKCIFKREKDREVYLISDNGEVRPVISKQEIRGHEGRFGIFAGTLRELLKERKNFFPDLDSVARYYNIHGKMPWGIKSLIISRGWYNRTEEGYRYVIVNEAGNETLKLRRDGGIELGLFTPIF